MLELLLVALAVGVDNFGAAVGLGIGGVTRDLRLQVGLVFGLFEAGMPVVGILAGSAFASDLGKSASVISGILLGAMGAYSVLTSILKSEPSRSLAKPGLKQVLVLGVVLSIDNLVIGFALGARHQSLVVALVVIGVVSTALSLLGLELGRKLGAWLGETGEVFGGLILVVVGILVGTGVL
jgi:manganese efflux pump family protein